MKNHREEDKRPRPELERARTEKEEQRGGWRPRRSNGGWCLWGPCCHSPWRFFCVTACPVLPRWRAEAQAAFLPPSCLVFSDRVEAWASSWGWGRDTYSSMPRDRWCTVVFLVFFVHCSCSSWGKGLAPAFFFRKDTRTQSHLCCFINSQAGAQTPARWFPGAGLSIPQRPSRK